MQKPLVRIHEDNDMVLLNRVAGQRILLAGDENWSDEEMVYNALHNKIRHRRIDYIIFPGHERLYQEDGKPYPVTPGKSQKSENQFEDICYRVAERLSVNTSAYELVELPYTTSIMSWHDSRNRQMCIHATSIIVFTDNYADNHVLRNLLIHAKLKEIEFEVVHH